MRTTWAVWGMCLAVTVALAVLGRAGSPLAIAAVAAYFVPVAAAAVAYGRLAGGALGAACLLVSTIAWPGVAAPGTLPLLALEMLVGAVVVVLAPWVVVRFRTDAVGGNSHRPAHAHGRNQVHTELSDTATVAQTHESDDRLSDGTPSSEGAEDRQAPAGPVPGYVEQPARQPESQNPPPGVVSGGNQPGRESQSTKSQSTEPPQPDRRAAVFSTDAADEAGLIADLFRFCRAQIPSAERGMFLRAGEEGGLKPADSFGFEAAELSGAGTARGVGVLGVVAATGRSHVLDDLYEASAETEPLRDFHRRVGLRSAVVGSLTMSGSNLGVLVLYSSRSGAFNLSDRAALERACSTAAPLLANVRTLTRMSDEVKEAHFLIEMSRMLGGPRGLDALMAYLIEKAKQMVGGDVASVMLVDPTTEELAIARAEGLPAEIVASTRVAVGDGIAGWVAENSKPLILRDFPVNGHNNKRVEWAVSIPLAAGGDVVGVLNVGSTRRGRAVSDEDLGMLLKLAAQAATCISNTRALTAMQQLHFQTMRALVAALEAVDPYGRGHSENVARYASAIARRMHLPDEQVRMVETAGMLHDIGKVSLGSSLLRKSKPLTTIEQVAIRFHPAMATEILKDVPMLAGVLPAITHHHEWFGGGGYGEGLKGEQIPLAARILAVADAFEAMTSTRAYRGAMNVEEALAELARGAGKQFDPHVVDVFQALLQEDPALVDKRLGSEGRPADRPTA